MKYFVAVAFVLIIGSLASAFISMMRSKSANPKMVRAFALRVGFSIALFIAILVLAKLGYIKPTGIR
ncbi:DUF2909 domain-containing protein [Pseudoduganella sp. HUAS MS19]